MGGVAGSAGRGHAWGLNARDRLWRLTVETVGLDRRENLVSTGDKFKNKAQEFKGKAKESFGDATDNRDMENEGKTDQAGANARQAGENVKDSVRDLGTSDD